MRLAISAFCSSERPQDLEDNLITAVLVTTFSYDGRNGAATKIDGKDLKIGVLRA